MISNFSEVEKSLKRCLKEKVSITAATVVGFLIAGTAAFGDVKPVEFTTATGGQVTINVNSAGADDVSGAANFISVAQYKELAGNNGALENLLTVKTNDKGETIFAGAKDQADTLGKVTARATNDGAITLLKTDDVQDSHKSIVSSLDIDAVGVSGYIATAMEAAGEGHTVTNDGAITVGNYAVGMKANAGATAVNNVDKTITVEGTDGVGMLAVTAVDKTTTLTNNGKITVTESIGMATGQLLEGAEAALINKGTIDVTDGVGIKVEGAGTTTVTGGDITVNGMGAGIDGRNYTGKLTVDKTKISVANGTGIFAEGNAELKDIAITLTNNSNGVGINYNGKNDEATAKISTSDINLSENGLIGISAILSKHANSKLDIETGSLTTAVGKTGIGIRGGGATDPGESKQTTAEVKTTLGATAGTGVTIEGKAYNDIRVSLNDSSAKDASKAVVDGTGVNIASGEAEGTTTVNINQSNLQVANNGKLVNVANNTDGAVNIKVNQNVELIGTGNLIEVGAIAGTTTVDINKDITITGSGNIVKAGAISTGILNVNLNVEEDTGLNVASEKTALDLSTVSAGNTASVKNTGTVTIARKGTLVKGHDLNDIYLTNQGLITLNTVDTATANNSSHISTGKKVNVANYGTIDLAISSADFLTASASGKGSLDALDIAEVITALKTLGVVDTSSTGDFSSVG